MTYGPTTLGSIVRKQPPNVGSPVASTINCPVPTNGAQTTCTVGNSHALARLNICCQHKVVRFYTVHHRRGMPLMPYNCMSSSEQYVAALVSDSVDGATPLNYHLGGLLGLIYCQIASVTSAACLSLIIIVSQLLMTSYEVIAHQPLKIPRLSL